MVNVILQLSPCLRADKAITNPEELMAKAEPTLDEVAATRGERI